MKLTHEYSEHHFKTADGECYSVAYHMRPKRDAHGFRFTARVKRNGKILEVYGTRIASRTAASNLIKCLIS